jgi:hypothetical protein
VEKGLKLAALDPNLMVFEGAVATSHGSCSCPSSILYALSLSKVSEWSKELLVFVTMTQSNDLRFPESSDSGEDGTSRWPDRRNAEIHEELAEEFISGSSEHEEDLDAVGRWNGGMWTHDRGLASVSAPNYVD